MAHGTGRISNRTSGPWPDTHVTAEEGLKGHGRPTQKEPPKVEGSRRMQTRTRVLLHFRGAGEGSGTQKSKGLCTQIKYPKSIFPVVKFQFSPQ